MIKIGYKVTWEFDGKHRSFNASNVESPDSFEYKIGEWTNKKWGSLALFDTFLAAKVFLERFYWMKEHTFQIYKAEYETSLDSKLWFYDGEENIYTHRDLPTGTILASKIKLLERVL